MPASMWLSHLKIDTPACVLRYDLAVDASGYSPSPWAAGLPGALLPPIAAKTDINGALVVALFVGAGVLLIGAYFVGRSDRPALHP